jgi:single-strand DNA-binding protein
MNKVFLIGRLTHDPELRHTQSGMACCQITLAVNRPKQKDKEQETDFINVVVWDKQGENLAKYQTKGNQIAVEGRIQTRNYENSEGKKVFVTEVIASNVMYLDSKKETSNGQQSGQQSGQETTQDPYADFGTQITVEDLDKSMVSDDDLPF